MREELQEIIFNRFPTMFELRKLPMTQTTMCWGIECPDAWFALIYNMCHNLHRIETKYGVVVIADQVKEKYGTLRFYHHVVYGERWTRKTNHVLLWLQTVINKGISSFNCSMSRRKSKLRVSWVNFKTEKWFLDGKRYTDNVFKNGWEGGGRGIKALIADDVENRIAYTINLADHLSSKVCSVCGTIGTFENPLGCTQGWISYICKNCLPTDGGCWAPIRTEIADE